MLKAYIGILGMAATFAAVLLAITGAPINLATAYIAFMVAMGFMLAGIMLSNMAYRIKYWWEARRYRRAY